MFGKRSITALVILMAVLLSGCSTAQKLMHTKDIRPVADMIAGYSLPEGYSEQFAVDLLDYQIVSLQGQTPNCHIYLVQAPEDSDIDLVALQNQNRTKDEHFLRDLEVVEARTATIRGQEVTLYVSEGTNGEGLAYRGVIALFVGRNGPAAVSITSPFSLWDWDQVDAFIASLD